LVPRLEDAGFAEERAHGVGGLSAVVEPVVDARRIEVQRLFALTRRVLAEDLDEAPVARALRVGDDDAIERLLFPPGAAETNLHGHCTVLMRVLVLRRAHRAAANRPRAPGTAVGRKCRLMSDALVQRPTSHVPRPTSHVPRPTSPRPEHIRPELPRATGQVAGLLHHLLHLAELVEQAVHLADRPAG